MYRVEYAAGALRDLKRIDPQWRKRILLAIDALAENPFRHPQVKRLVGSSYYRLRVGDYRVIFDLETRRVTIVVIHVKARGAAYRSGGCMAVQYLQVADRTLAVLDLKGMRDLTEYVEDLEDSLEAIRRQLKHEPRRSGDAVRRELLENRIRQIRVEKGWTQQALAKRLRTTQAFVSKIERSTYRPSLKVLKKVATAFGVAVEALV